MGNVSTSSYFGLSGTAAARFLTWFHFEKKCAQAHLKTRAARDREHYSGFVCRLGLPGASLEITGTSSWWSEVWCSDSTSCFSPAGIWLWLVRLFWVLWACSFQLQARFYSITESYLKPAGRLPWPQHHLFSGKGKENRRFVVRCDEL